MSSWGPRFGRDSIRAVGGMYTLFHSLATVTRECRSSVLDKTCLSRIFQNDVLSSETQEPIQVSIVHAHES